MEGGFDEQRAVVVRGPGGVGGPGVVARFPGLVCVAGSTGDDDTDALSALLDLCAQAAGPAPGRPLGRSLARWLARPDAPDLVVGTVAAAGDRVAVFLAGDVDLTVADTGETLSGRDAVAWTDRLIAHDGGPLVLALGGVGPPADDRPTGDPPTRDVRWLDLRSGVVPGSGVALVPDGTRSGAAPGGGPTGAHAAPAPPPAVEVAAPPVVRAPRRSARIHGHGEGEQRPPLPVGAGPTPQGPSPEGRAAEGPLPEGRAGAPAPAGGPSRTPDDEALTERSREPTARGYVCARGHLNDPRALFCVRCGIRMDERTGVLTTGPRPPLGLLVFDDGTTYTVDAEYVVGRTPEADARVRGAELRALTVHDRGGTVSRVHAEIRVQDWDVVLVDVGSRNGTFVVPPGGTAWERMPGHRSMRLVPGTRVRLGHHRTFVFESPSGVR